MRELATEVVLAAGLFRLCPICGQLHATDDPTATARAMAMGLLVRNASHGFHNMTDRQVHRIITRTIDRMSGCCPLPHDATRPSLTH